MSYDATFDGYKNKLKGRLFGLLCEKEKDGEWEKFLDSIIIEVRGLASSCTRISCRSSSTTRRNSREPYR